MVYKKRMNCTSPFGVRRSLLFLICALALTACAAPSPGPAEKKVFKLGRHRVWLERLHSSDPYLKNRKFSHPSLVGPAVLEKQIRSFRYKGLALLSRKRKVFPGPKVRVVAALMARALAQARPDETVRFSIHRKDGSTTGDLFVSGNRIHWRFSAIQGKVYTRHGAGNWLDSWKLVLNKGQKYHGIPGLFGKSAVENWIVMPLKKTAAARPTPRREKDDRSRAKAAPEKTLAPKKSMAPEITPGRLERDLIRLKRLRRKDLITEEEFQKKKKYLLDRGF